MARMALRLRFLTLVPILSVIGCDDPPAALYPLEEKTAAPPVLASNFDPAACGSIRGRVHGPRPESHSFRDAGVHPGSFADPYDGMNRLVPRIDAKGNGVAGAIVFLRKVDPDRSRPWDLPPVEIEMKRDFIVARQDGDHLAGFVHAGEAIEMISRGDGRESLRARGAAFFTLPFPKPDQPLRRTLRSPGLVELSSAVGHFWTRCWLFVVEHPYFVRTDKSGHFTLDQIPDGIYELAIWMPDWRVERFEHDPETFAVARLWFRNPLEKSMSVRVERGQVATAEFLIGMADFEQAAR